MSRHAVEPLLCHLYPWWPWLVKRLDLVILETFSDFNDFMVVFAPPRSFSPFLEVLDGGRGLGANKIL